jgi:hypothetical protein
MTGLIYLYDSQRSARHQTDELLRWARQIAAQAEGLALNAREHEESDPIGWAVGYLTQGAEPRVMKVTKYASIQLAQPRESFQFDRKARVFDFVKILTPEDGTGVRIQLFPEVLGFLGAKSRVSNDLAIAAVFLACFFFFFTSTGRYFGFRLVSPASEKASDLKPRIREWVGEAKQVLTQLGLHVRELTREAQNLAVAAAKSRSAMSGLRDSVHGGIRDVHAGRQSLRQMQALLAQAESADASPEIQRFFSQMRELVKSADAAVKDIELQLEPWSTDADEAFHSYDDVFRASESMTSHIRKATETMIGQARLMQSLTGQLAEVSSAEKTPARKSSAANGKAMAEAFPEETSKPAPVAAPAKPPRRRPSSRKIA